MPKSKPNALDKSHWGNPEKNEATEKRQEREAKEREKRTEKMSESLFGKKKEPKSKLSSVRNR
jgi:hypothetical protein